jgi:hypothetical protein
MKTKTIEWWNNLKKNEDTDVIAIEGDTVCYIDGIAFLIQRKNGFNNVVCWKVKTSRKNIVDTFYTFRAFCEKKKIQYTRVEGIGKHHYKMLYLVLKRCPEYVNIVYNEDESKEYDRHIWYIKNY